MCVYDVYWSCIKLMTAMVLYATEIGWFVLRRTLFRAFSNHANIFSSKILKPTTKISNSLINLQLINSRGHNRSTEYKLKIIGRTHLLITTEQSGIFGRLQVRLSVTSDIISPAYHRATTPWLVCAPASCSSPRSQWRSCCSRATRLQRRPPPPLDTCSTWSHRADWCCARRKIRSASACASCSGASASLAATSSRSSAAPTTFGTFALQFWSSHFKVKLSADELLLLLSRSLSLSLSL